MRSTARSLPPFGPEFALATACALFDDARLREVAPALAGRPGFDWERLIELATYNGVEQVVRSRLNSLVPGAMPADLSRALQRDLMRDMALQTAQAATSVRVTQVLAAAGIDALALKGVALAQMLYAPEPELRWSSDVDILVAPGDFRAADHALRQAGLARSWPEADPPEAARPMFMRLVNVFNYRGAVMDELVELHSRPTLNPYWVPASFAELRATSAEVETAQGRLRTLDGPLNLQYLCQHALYYLGFRLKWFGDIARALRRAGAGSCAGYIAEYARPLPENPGRFADEILQALEQGVERAAADDPRPVRTGTDAGRIVGHMIRAEDIPTGRTLSRLPTELWFHSLAFRHLPGARGKARQMCLALSHPADALRLRLSPRFSFVYCLVGPVLAAARLASRRRDGAAPAS